MALRTLTSTDLQDILCGAALLGSGGGGPLTIGQQIISQLPEGAVRLADPQSDVPDDAEMAVVSFTGIPSVLAKEHIDYAEVSTAAFTRLEQEKETQFAFSLPLETGAGNSFIAIAAAALKNIPVVDADGGRRAVPSPMACTWATLPIAPLVMQVDDQTWLTINAPSMALLIEAMIPVALNSTSFNRGEALAMWAMSGSDMKHNAVNGSVTYALELGTAIRLALASHADPVEAAVNYLNGTLMFVGTLDSFTQGVMTMGSTVLVNGTTEVTILNQPDNIMAWSNQSPTPLAMAPDLICFMTTDGQPMSIADLGLVKKGQSVALIGAPAVPQLRAAPLNQVYAAALQAIGYNGPYVPIETLHASSSTPLAADEKPMPRKKTSDV